MINVSEEEKKMKGKNVRRYNKDSSFHLLLIILCRLIHGYTRCGL